MYVYFSVPIFVIRVASMLSSRLEMTWTSYRTFYTA